MRPPCLRSRSVAGFGPRIVAVITTLLSVLLYAAPAHAARVYSPDWDAPESGNTLVTPAPYSRAASMPAEGQAVLVATGLMETTISSLSAEQDTGANTPSTLRSVELSSLAISSYDTSTAPPLSAMYHANEDAPQAGSNTDTMSLVSLAWLFGIGIIGMGMVGRRKQSKC